MSLDVIGVWFNKWIAQARDWAAIFFSSLWSEGGQDGCGYDWYVVFLNQTTLVYIGWLETPPLVLGTCGGNFSCYVTLADGTWENWHTILFSLTWLCKVVLPLSQRCWQLFFVQTMFFETPKKKICRQFLVPLTNCWVRGMTIEVCAWCKGQWFIWFRFDPWTPGMYVIVDILGTKWSIAISQQSNRWLVFWFLDYVEKKHNIVVEMGWKSRLGGNQRVFRLCKCTYLGSWGGCIGRIGVVATLVWIGCKSGSVTGHRTDFDD